MCELSHYVTCLFKIHMTYTNYIYLNENVKKSCSFELIMLNIRIRRTSLLGKKHGGYRINRKKSDRRILEKNVVFNAFILIALS